MGSVREGLWKAAVSSRGPKANSKKHCCGYILGWEITQNVFNHTISQLPISDLFSLNHAVTCVSFPILPGESIIHHLTMYHEVCGKMGSGTGVCGFFGVGGCCFCGFYYFLFLFLFNMWSTLCDILMIIVIIIVIFKAAIGFGSHWKPFSHFYFHWLNSFPAGQNLTGSQLMSKHQLLESFLALYSDRHVTWSDARAVTELTVVPNLCNSNVSLNFWLCT